ncbi:hypothetical protein DU475_08180 [Rhodopseudomonas sp. WA056]|uniref:hypothetical protein n=1 Tax=Rhodopseudomonas sp. WA056 TaxID=2269367 RepID=UPI0013DEFF7A|nr:hypothetical protein [Rhodopseudomonas sp. WA056]NEW87238.1 hypothetical protein [Rhodopseudomonas sp. WA056]
MQDVNKAQDRGANAIKTEYGGVTYRSQTEARWAVFFDTLGVQFQYEPETITLSSGEKYLPDFYLKDFDAYFEVKPNDEKIVTEESVKARCLSHDKPGQRVWLAIGGPAPKTANVLVLEKWKRDVPIEEILGNSDNRYWFHEDRRDEKVYWLHSENVEGFVVGGPGKSTIHERPPLNHATVEKAYFAARIAMLKPAKK